MEDEFMREKGISWDNYRKTIQNETKGNPTLPDLQGEQTCDVLYITALEDEFEHLLNVYSIDNSEYTKKNGLSFISFTYEVNKTKNVRIVLTKPCGKGLTPTAATVTQAIIEFRPVLVLMTGVCATPKGKADFGDILMFKSVYLHDEGKITPDGRQPNIVPITIPRKSETVCDILLSNPDIPIQIARKWPEKLTRREPLHIQKGLAASGSAVIADKEYIAQTVSHNRELLAIDMEAYAIAYCATYVADGCDWLVIKSVQDNGDENKDKVNKDMYRHYSAFTSAMCSLHFVKEYFDV